MVSPVARPTRIPEPLVEVVFERSNPGACDISRQCYLRERPVTRFIWERIKVRVLRVIWPCSNLKLGLHFFFNLHHQADALCLQIQKEGNHFGVLFACKSGHLSKSDSRCTLSSRQGTTRRRQPMLLIDRYQKWLFRLAEDRS